jgi:hypothetical protein
VSLFDVDSADGLAQFLETEIDAPYVRAQKSTLGGAQQVSVLLIVSLDPPETWTNKILQNSHYFIIHIFKNGTVEEIVRARGERFVRGKKFRKTKADSWPTIADKVNKYISEIR